MDRPAGPAAGDLEHFHIAEADAGWLLCRSGHVVGFITEAGGHFAFVRAGYQLPTFRTADHEALIEHLVDVVASVLRPCTDQTPAEKDRSS